MKFIHTADWHLGNRFHEIDRSDEFKNFLQWLKEEIVKESVECLIIAGDIFDVANPSVEARKIYFSFLASLINTCCKNIIVIAGNHDSAIMLEASKELLECLNIHVVGSINNQEIKNLVFELYNKNNELTGVCCAVPFIREVEMRAYGDNMANAHKKIYEQTYEYAKNISKNKNVPIIATGHLYATDLEGRLKNIPANKKSDDGTKVLDVIGNLGCVGVDSFTDNFDYVALGHIHYSTTVGKKSNIRYSGSPFILGFDECHIPHKIIIGEVEKDENNNSKLDLKKIDTPNYFVFKRIEGNSSEIKKELKKISSEETEKNIFIEIFFEKEIGINIQVELNEEIKNLPEKIKIVSWKRKEKKANTEKINDLVDIDDVLEFSDEEIFKSLILTKENLDENSPEGKKVLEKFLPLFLKIANDVDIGKDDNQFLKDTN